MSKGTKALAIGIGMMAAFALFSAPVQAQTLPVLRYGSAGDQVRVLQTELAAEGFSPGPIDGKFGPATLRAVKAFQQAHHLTVDGVVGPATWSVLQQLYHPGTAAKSSSQRQGTSQTKSHPAPYSKQSSVSSRSGGTSFFDPQPVVNPYQTYTYAQMEHDIQQLAAQYPGLIHYEVVGQTVYGRNLYAVSLGTGKATVFINGSHHGREWITTNLVMYMIDQYAQAYAKNQSIDGYSVRDILDKTTIWFMPMVNPDGVTLSQFGPSAFPASVRQQLIQWNDGSTDFSRWKSNAQGIDPNRQYDGGWAEEPWFVYGPHWSTYKGDRPFEINEVKALVELVKQINAQEEVSYHASGGFIYWGWRIAPANYNSFHALALKMGKLTGYTVAVPPPDQQGGGMTDWWTHNVGRPGFTIEVGPYCGNSPVPVKYFSDIWRQNRDVGLELAVEGYQRYQQHPNDVIQ